MISSDVEDMINIWTNIEIANILNLIYLYFYKTLQYNNYNIASIIYDQAAFNHFQLLNKPEQIFNS